MSDFPQISENPSIQAHYEKCRREGTGHSLAEMFAHARPPMSNTDREFLEGRCNGNQFERTPHVGDLYRRQAEQAGVSTTGKYYMGGLARYPGDPTAWVNDRADVQRICTERGYDCSGAVNVRGARTDAPPAAVPLADDIVRDEVAEIVAAVPEGDRAKLDVGEIAHGVREKRTPKWKE